MTAACVFWLDWWPGYDVRGHWDQHQLITYLHETGATERTQRDPTPPEGVEAAAVVVPGGFAKDDLTLVNSFIAAFARVLVIVTSDEASLFPYEGLVHPDMRLWVMTPRPDRGRADRYLGEGYPPGTRETLSPLPVGDRPKLWGFAGQINHGRRMAMKAATAALTGPQARDRNLWHMTYGFAQGMPRPDYLQRLTETRAVLCPAGPVTPDSFRVYEALEAGCLPIVDAACPAYPDARYWQHLFGHEPPFPLIHNWEHDLPAALDAATAGWPVNSNRVQAWWQQQKCRYYWDLVDTLTWLDGIDRRGDITVLLSTSPIPSHPDTTIIETTVASIRERLPDATIIVMVDGVSPGHEHRRADYNEYVRRLLWLTNHRWGRCYPIVADEWMHQANMTRLALDMVRTPTVLFMEHDTPLEQDIPFGQLVQPIFDGHADLIRLHFESEILGVHRHLMLDREPQMVSGVPLVRTYQWSQRPHLASTLYYRERLDQCVGPDARCFIEDVVIGVVERTYLSDQRYGWYRNRLFIYTPPGNIRRSHHLDGRGEEAKGPQRFAYPTDQIPPGAPNPRWIPG